MAARKRTYQTDSTREKIRTTQLVNRLQKFALGPENEEAPIDLSQAQIKAIDILLSKTLPALTQADITQHNVPDPITYEEAKAELIRTKGEPMALFMLGEITEGQLLTILQQTADKSEVQKQREAMTGFVKKGTDSDEEDVAPSHSHVPETLQ